jgi:hypothetical protein
VVRKITKPSGRDARPARRLEQHVLRARVLAELPELLDEDPVAFLPLTVSLSAATTRSVAPVSRCVIVR